VDVKANNKLNAGDRQALRLLSPGGVAILEWPEDSTVAV
jgi:hypothetical protein